MDQHNNILESIQYIRPRHGDFMARICEDEFRNEELTTKNSALEVRIVILENSLDL